MAAISPETVFTIISKTIEICNGVVARIKRRGQLEEELREMRNMLKHVTAELAKRRAKGKQGLSLVWEEFRRHLRSAYKNINAIKSILQEWIQGEKDRLQRARKLVGMMFKVGFNLDDELDGPMKALVDSRERIQRWTQMCIMTDLNLLSGPSVPHGQLAKRKQRIIFVDYLDRDLSRIAQAYTLLCTDFATRRKNPWPIASVDSAGIFIKHASSIPTKSKPWCTHAGGAAPSQSALASLFDNWYDYRGKQTRRDYLQRIKTKGLPKDIGSYDYILVFTQNQLWCMKQIQQHLRSHGKKFNAQILLLGDTTDGIRANTNSAGFVSDWLPTVNVIKLAVKKFLREELDQTSEFRGTQVQNNKIRGS